jgi:hypothetical protein
VCAFNEGRKNEAKVLLILFLFVLVPPWLFVKEDEIFFFASSDFKSAHGKKISPALSAPFV